MPDVAKLIAFYLPQFHPIPENDAWWGTGFTEWTNVTRATPQFVGHEQPHLPADLGFYDLRLPEVHLQQAALARRYGIHGFCYHYYYFGGRRLLERPLELMLADARIDLPFCLCYANPSWNRTWDDHHHARLITQQYSPEHDLGFIRSLFPYLRDPRYIRIDGRALLVVYMTAEFPDMRATTARWREACREAGLGELYIVRVETYADYTPPSELGCDAACEFPPHNLTIPMSRLAPDQLLERFAGAVYDYRLVAELYQRRQRPAHPLFRTVVPGWDNTARKRTQATIMRDATPESYFDWLTRAIDDTVTHHPPAERIVFINAWNEWAEGAHLEPCQRHGHRFLEATRDALESCGSTTTEVRTLKAHLRRTRDEIVGMKAELEEHRRDMSRLELRLGKRAIETARRVRGLWRKLTQQG